MRALSIAVLSLSLSIASAAVAQEPTEEARARAREIFTEARAAFQLEQWDRALELFREAYALSPHDAVRFNVAVCLERLGRMREAREEYAALAASGALEVEQRARAEQRAREIEAQLATLVVEGTPGAVVIAGGATLCTVPCRVVRDPGDVDLEIVEGDRRRDVHVELRAGGTFALRLDAQRDAIAVPPQPAPVDTPGDPAPVVLVTLGSVLAAAGIGGVIGFGLRAQDLWAQWDAAPTLALKSDGELMRDLANVSIAVLAGGAVLAAIGVVLALTSGRPAGEGAVTIRDGRLAVSF